MSPLDENRSTGFGELGVLVSDVREILVINTVSLPSYDHLPTIGS